MRWARLCLLFLALLTSASLAGVVEDAEELLKDLPSDVPVRTTLYPNADSSRSSSFANSVTSRTNASTRASTNSSSSAASQSPTRRSNQTTSPDRGKTELDSAAKPAESEASRRRSLQESKDRALTFGGVLLVVFFIALAGYYGRRLAGSSD